MPHPRVLVIEDDPDISALLRDILEGDGYLVLSAARTLDPDEIAQLQPELIVLDLWLGTQSSGLDMLQALRETPDTRHVPVLVCTADARAALVESERFEALAADVLLKPFAIDDLLERVAAACRDARESVVH